MRWKHLDALIMAGGQGRRLNQDKVRLELANGPVLENLTDLCLGIFGRVRLIVDRLERVRSTRERVSVVADESPGLGPLGGLLTGLRAAESETCFVTACDIPFLSRELILHLAARVADQDLVVPGRGESVEPLIGFYRRSCCPAITRAIAAGDLRMRSFWPQVRAEIVDLRGSFAPEDLDTWLLNVNTRSDLEIAAALAARGERR